MQLVHHAGGIAAQAAAWKMPSSYRGLVPCHREWRGGVRCRGGPWGPSQRGKPAVLQVDFSKLPRDPFHSEVGPEALQIVQYFGATPRGTFLVASTGP